MTDIIEIAYKNMTLEQWFKFGKIMWLVETELNNELIHPWRGRLVHGPKLPDDVIRAEELRLQSIKASRLADELERVYRSMLGNDKPGSDTNRSPLGPG